MFALNQCVQDKYKIIDPKIERKNTLGLWTTTGTEGTLLTGLGRRRGFTEVVV